MLCCSFPLHQPAPQRRDYHVNWSFLSCQPLLLHPMASLCWSVCVTPWFWPGNSQPPSAALTSQDTLWITEKSLMVCRGSGTRPISSLSARGRTGWAEVTLLSTYTKVSAGIKELKGGVVISSSPGEWPEGEHEVSVPGEGGQHGRCGHPISAQ